MDMPSEFFTALEQRKVDQAAALWSQQAEAVLAHLHREQVGPIARLGQPRGKTQCDSTRQLPRVLNEHAGCLQFAAWVRHFGGPRRFAKLYLVLVFYALGAICSRFYPTVLVSGTPI